MLPSETIMGYERIELPELHLHSRRSHKTDESAIPILHTTLGRTGGKVPSDHPPTGRIIIVRKLKKRSLLPDLAMRESKTHSSVYICTDLTNATMKLQFHFYTYRWDVPNRRKVASHCLLPPQEYYHCRANKKRMLC